jgi:hypothetical protein
METWPLFSLNSGFFFVFVFEIGSHYVAQADLKFIHDLPASASKTKFLKYNYFNKNTLVARHWWLMSVIPATWDPEIGRILV